MAKSDEPLLDFTGVANQRARRTLSPRNSFSLSFCELIELVLLYPSIYLSICLSIYLSIDFPLVALIKSIRYRLILDLVLCTSAWEEEREGEEDEEEEEK